MADNTQLPGTGDVVRDIDRVGVKTQVVALDAGGAAGESLVSVDHPLPVSVGNFPAEQPISAAALPLPDGAATDAVIIAATGSAGAAPPALAASASGLIGWLRKIAETLLGGINVSWSGQSVSVDNFPAPQSGAVLVASTTDTDPSYSTLVGDPNGDFAGVNLLEQVIADDSGLGFNVKVLNAPKADLRGAAIPSDAPAPIFLSSNRIGDTFIIDTQGYQSLSLHAPNPGGMSAAITTSNDSSTWVGLVGAGSAQAYTSSISAGNILVFPCLGRYIRIVSASVGSVTAYLRQQPAPLQLVTNNGVNISQVGGTAPPTAGVAGTTVVGGANINAAAPTSNPLAIAAVDSGTIGIGGGAVLVRRILSDNQGRLRLAQEGIVQDTKQPFLSTRDNSQGFDGQAMVDLLSQILAEKRIQTQYLFALVSMGTDTIGEPADYRNNPEIFN
jgi:hypothetical protein